MDDGRDVNSLQVAHMVDFVVVDLRTVEHDQLLGVRGYFSF